MTPSITGWIRHVVPGCFETYYSDLEHILYSARNSSLLGIWRYNQIRFYVQYVWSKGTTVATTCRWDCRSTNVTPSCWFAVAPERPPEVPSRSEAFVVRLAHFWGGWRPSKEWWAAWPHSIDDFAPWHRAEWQCPGPLIQWIVSSIRVWALFRKGWKNAHCQHSRNVTGHASDHPYPRYRLASPFGRQIQQILTKRLL